MKIIYSAVALLASAQSVAAYGPVMVENKAAARSHVMKVMSNLKSAEVAATHTTLAVVTKTTETTKHATAKPSSTEKKKKLTTSKTKTTTHHKAARDLEKRAVSSSSSTVSISTTVIGADGFTTVPWPPSCTTTATNTYAAFDNVQNELYYFMCGAGTVGTSFYTNTTSANWQACFALCDATSGCTSFSYNGGAAYGISGGGCYLKNTNPNGFTSQSSLSSTRVAAVRARYATFGQYYTATTVTPVSATVTSTTLQTTVTSTTLQTTIAAQPTTTAAASSSISSSTTTIAASSTTSATDACGPLPNFGVAYTPATAGAAAFLADTYINGLTATTPANYNLTFTGFYASLTAPGYLGYLDLPSYNATACAVACDSAPALAGCKGFALYAQRTPTLFPAPACPNPVAQTYIRCAFYSQPIAYTELLEVGQWRQNFAVVIAASNGYNKLY